MSSTENFKNKESFIADLAAPILEMLEPKEGEEILDLGCGDGTLALEIKKAGAKVQGVDLNTDKVIKAREKGIDASVANITQISFDNQFDAIFSNAVLNWVQNQTHAIHNVHKALKNGGRLIAEFGGDGNIKTITDAMQEVFASDSDFGSFKNPWYYPSASEYKALLEDNGFKVEYCELVEKPTRVVNIDMWLDAFAAGIISHLTKDEKIEFKNRVKKILEPKLYTKEDDWTLDYVRLRVKAIKV
jgi:trans-aconitate methyltransferase